MKMKHLENNPSKRNNAKKPHKTQPIDGNSRQEDFRKISALRHRYTEKLTYANKAPDPRGYLKHKGPQDVAD